MVVESRKPNTIPSPCVRVCRLRDDNVCQGCLRTLQEIMAWPNLTDNEKLAILNKLETRLHPPDKTG